MSSKPEFVLEVNNSQIQHRNGIKNVKFIHDCEDILKNYPSINGLVYVTKSVEGIKLLKTSSEIPTEIAQRMRNTWNFYS